MLRINQSRETGHAKSYYSTADYYSEGQELSGWWRGEGARRLGLQGEVRKADWEAMCDNLHPGTGERLTVRTRSDRTVAYDFNFHCPKSVSLLYGMTRDERLLEAFRESVDAAMQDIEAEMATRVRKGRKNENRITGNMVWGEYVHLTSRPVDGVPDPHLHAHCVVLNTTFDEKEQRWKAGQFRNIKRDGEYFEALFHSRLAGRLSDLGLPIERTRNGWELAGVNKPLVNKFSRRTAQIANEEPKEKERIEKQGRKFTVEDRARIGAKTREKKQKDLSMDELWESWRGRMTPAELDLLKTLDQRIGGDAEPADATAGAKAVEYAKRHVFERKSVVPERQLLSEALRHSVGEAKAEEVLREAQASDLIIGERGDRRMVTTHAVLADEEKVIDFARAGRGACSPYQKRLGHFNREWLNGEQKEAVRHIVESRDRVMVVRGAAGVGKTTLLQEAREAIEQSGTKVFAFATSSTASRIALREAGFEEATTLATLMINTRLQEKARGQLLLVDEAGLVSARSMAELFQLADRIDARVLLSGDRFQHSAVERGSPLRQLETEAGLVPAQVKEIQRQSDAYKSAVKSLADGRVGEGFSRLDELGWIKELPDGDRERQVAADYVDSLLKGKKSLVVCPTHREGDRITQEIRSALRQADALGDEEHAFSVLQNANLTEAERGDSVNYLPGDVLVFHQNAKGYTRGDRVVVDGSCPLPLEYASRFQVFHQRTLQLAEGDAVRITHNGVTADGKHRLSNGMVYSVKGFDEGGNIVLENGWQVGRNWGHLAHGHVVTSHASQGRTVDHVFVAQSADSLPASSREQFYVSCSRARTRATIYTDSKEDLLEAVSQSDERLTAMDLIKSGALRPTDALRDMPDDKPGGRSAIEREELVYDR